jgi:hypothetical protein
MAARVFDIYDLNSPMVTPTPTAPAAAPPQATPAKRNSERLLRGCAYLLAFAGVLLLAALTITVTPLGAIDADITVPFVAVVVGVPTAIAIATVRQ